MYVNIGNVERNISRIDGYLLGGGPSKSGESVEEILTNSRADRLIKKIHKKKVNETIFKLVGGKSDTAEYPIISPIPLELLGSREDAGNKAKKIEMNWAKEADQMQKKNYFSFRYIQKCDKDILEFLREIMPPLDADNNPITESDLRGIKISNESYTFITFYKDSEDMLEILKRKLPKPLSTLVANDLTSNVGGNVLGFGKEFKSVISVEIDPTIHEYLRNNINVYKFKNVETFRADATEWIKDKEYVGDVVFMDPPWGGLGYRREGKMRLSLSGISIEDITTEIMNKPKPPLMTVLKLPQNYDLDFLRSKLSNFKIEELKIRKLLVVLIT